MLINPLYRPVAGHSFADVIDDYPLGIVVCSELVATHMPMLAVRNQDGSVDIEGHVPRADPLYPALARGADLLLIFPGPSAYVSPDWYTHVGLPTYDFEPVHVRGRASLMDNAALEGHLRRLIEHHETRVRPRQEGGNAPSSSTSGPWSMDGPAKDSMQRLLQAIAGFRIRPDAVEFKSKIGQNRPADERPTTAQHLARLQHPDARYLADLMERCTDPRDGTNPPTGR